MDKEPYFLIKSVVRTLKIIEYLSQNDECSVKEVAEFIEENKTTAHRFLASIKHEGFIVQNSKNKKYKLSLKVFDIGNRVADKLDLRTIAGPVIKELSNKLSETINLGILNQGDIVHIDKAISYNGTALLDTPIGGREPAHCAALGKSILAFLPKFEIDNYIEKYGLIMKTKKTIIDPEQFHCELTKIRSQGYSFDNEEAIMGIVCVAAPIFDNRMNPIAAVSVTLLANEENHIKLEGYKDSIIIAANKISNELGAKI